MPNGRKYIYFIAAAILLSSSFSAFADDLTPPDWRGVPGTTLQIWEFNDDDNPALPEVDLNPYGDPTAFIEGDFPYTRWLAVDQGHEGVWLTEEFVLLDIQNTEITNPESFKNIWLQMTFYTDQQTVPLIVTTPGANPFTLEPIFVQQVDDYYSYAIWDILIEPNPTSELIYIMPRDCTLFVDQIVVDTRCIIPEPATVLLISLGGLALVVRRKR